MIQLSNEQQNKIQEIGRSHDLKLLVLYGSRAKGTANVQSDVDVAVLGNQGIDADGYSALYQELSKLFGNTLDLKSLHNTNVLFKYQVMKDAILLYGKHLDFVKFKVYAVNAYVDAKSLFRLQEQLVNQRIDSLAGTL